MLKKILARVLKRLPTAALDQADDSLCFCKAATICCRSLVDAKMHNFLTQIFSLFVCIGKYQNSIAKKR